MRSRRIRPDGGLLSRGGGLISPGGGLVRATYANSALLSAISSAGLGVPNVAMDYSLAASGSFSNAGTSGGAMAPGGSPTYENAFPSTVGGTGVAFSSVSADSFDGTLSAMGDPGSSSHAAMVVFSTDNSGSGFQNLVDKRDGAGSGYEMRISGTSGVVTWLTEESGGTTGVVNSSFDYGDGNDHYCAGGLDENANQVWAYGDLDSSLQTGTAPTLGSYTSSDTIAIGANNRDAPGSAGNCVVRYLIVWVGAAAEGITGSQLDALWSALGGS